MKILQNSDKQLVVAMKDSITILSDDKTLVSVDKENCATPVKECDDHDSSYPPTKVK